MSQVLEHHTFHGHGGGNDSLAPASPGKQAQHQPAKAAQPVAAAASVASPLQLGLEHRAVAALVGEEFTELTHHAGGKQPRHKQLAAVDTDRAMLTGVVDFDHAVAQVRVDQGGSGSVHG